MNCRYLVCLSLIIGGLLIGKDHATSAANATRNYAVAATASFTKSLSDIALSIDTNATDFLLFVYFFEEDKGMYYALSADGINWQTVNKKQPVFSPKTGSQKLVRDPSICRGVDGVYRMLWTTGWSGKDIGYASSPDLVHWSKPEAIAVGQSVDSITNCWAPEMFYDESKKHYLIFWSSNIGAWKKPGGEGRIYYVTTKDFKQFSQAHILFRNGYPDGGAAGNNGPIDAFLIKKEAGYVMFYKKDDNTGVPTLFYREANTPEGRWGEEWGPITPSTGDEGPSCVWFNDAYHVYTDPFQSDSAYVYVSKDLKSWQRKMTNLTMRHGGVIHIPRTIAINLLKMNGN